MRLSDKRQRPKTLQNPCPPGDAGRARAWQSGDTLEGAIYAETIPFTETRDYVQKVMANAVHYSGHLGSARLRLKDRMGWIPGR